MVGKIGSISEIATICAKQKRQGKSIGLITGCFDIIHHGHITLFRRAKKYCDLLIVGLDSDRTITINKGPNRPISAAQKRADVVSEFSSVDYVFILNGVFQFASKRADWYHEKILRKLRPNFLFTNPIADSHWRDKETRAKALDVGFVKLINRKSDSSSTIIKILDSEL